MKCVILEYHQVATRYVLLTFCLFDAPGTFVISAYELSLCALQTALLPLVNGDCHLPLRGTDDLVVNVVNLQSTVANLHVSNPCVYHGSCIVRV